MTAALGLQPPPLRAQEARSPELARQLTDALEARKADSFAAQDPSNPQRFVAVLYIPKSQLLVVAAEFANPAAFQARLSQRQYRDLYIDLQTSPERKQAVFFEDLNADGLSERGELPDAMQDGNNPRRVFDGDWKKHHVSRESYDEQFAAADGRYSELLAILVAQLT